AAGLRPVGHFRSHIGAEAHRGEVESARADPTGRGGDLATGRTGSDGSAGLPDASGAARASAGVGHLVGGRANLPHGQPAPRYWPAAFSSGSFLTILGASSMCPPMLVIELKTCRTVPVRSIT